MSPKKRQRERQKLDQESDLDIESAVNSVDNNLRPVDPSPTPLDSLVPNESGWVEEVPAGGGYTPTEDGGNPQHPLHDDDQEDTTPSDYEREIDRVDAGTHSKR